MLLGFGYLYELCFISYFFSQKAENILKKACCPKFIILVFSFCLK